MWPFTKIRHLKNIIEAYQRLVQDQEARLLAVSEDSATRGQMILEHQRKIFDLENQLMAAHALVTENKIILSNIVDHGTKVPNGTVKRLARTAKVAIERIDNAAIIAPPIENKDIAA